MATWACSICMVREIKNCECGYREQLKEIWEPKKFDDLSLIEMSKEIEKMKTVFDLTKAIQAAGTLGAECPANFLEESS